MFTVVCDRLGVAEVGELSLVSSDDLREIGLSRIEIQRFLRCQSETFGEHAVHGLSLHGA